MMLILNYQQLCDLLISSNFLLTLSLLKIFVFKMLEKFNMN